MNRAYIKAAEFLFSNRLKRFGPGLLRIFLKYRTLKQRVNKKMDFAALLEKISAKRKNFYPAVDDKIFF